MSRRVLSMLVLCALAGPVAAQGLGEAARKESERRSRARGATRTYTADDLIAGPSTTAPAVEPAAPTTAPGRSERDPVRLIPDDPAARAREELRWRRSVEGLRRNVGILEREAEQADKAATWSAYAGPMSCSGHVNTRHERNMTEVQEARTALATARQALEDLEEEARRAGIPPGWLR